MRHEAVIIRLPKVSNADQALDVRLTKTGAQITEASRFVDWLDDTWTDESWSWHMSDREAALTLPDLAREIWPRARLIQWRIP